MDRSKTISNELQFKSAVDELAELLRQQLAHARKGNAAAVEAFAERTNDLVKRLSESEFFSEPLFEDRRKELQELYGQICLALSAQMDDVAQSLGRIYKGRKAVTLYRDNI